MANEIETGKRQVRVWASADWVTVLTGAQVGAYRVIPEDGSGEFTVNATTDAELKDRITTELRRRQPQGR